MLNFQENFTEKTYRSYNFFKVIVKLSKIFCKFLQKLINRTEKVCKHYRKIYIVVNFLQYFLSKFREKIPPAIYCFLFMSVLIMIYYYFLLSG